jgi:hypothetical protein
MQEERESQKPTEDVEAHTRAFAHTEEPEDDPSTRDQVADEDDVEAHMMGGAPPAPDNRAI